MRRCNNAMRAGVVAFIAAALLGACADTSANYYERRESIGQAAGNAVAANKVIHMVDPWPRVSEDKNIAFNGERMQSAVERYRKNKVITPRGIGTASSYQPSAPSADPAGTAASAPVGQTVTQPAAATK